VLELLDVTYADYQVRAYAVTHLRSLSDAELQPYLLQLVQCVKFEPYHESPLARWLIERALQAPLTIGHPLFWHIKAELSNYEFAERYCLMLEEYVW
jgi:phosphatidylinositol-4,5-bisphosphate 3-kinase